MDFKTIKSLTETLESKVGLLDKACADLARLKGDGRHDHARISINGVMVDLLDWSPNGFVVSKRTAVIYREAVAYMELRVTIARGAVEGAEFNLRKALLNG